MINTAPPLDPRHRRIEHSPDDPRSASRRRGRYAGKECLARPAHWQCGNGGHSFLRARTGSPRGLALIAAIRRLWRGELPLADAFWNWAVLGGVAINAVSSLFFFALLANDEAIAALVVGHLLSVPYNIVAAVGVWRSADAYPGDRRWASTARVVTVIGMTILSVT